MSALSADPDLLLHQEATTVRHPVLGGLLVGVVLGTGLQLQQASLSPPWVYGVFLLVSAAVAALSARKNIAFEPWRGVVVCVAAASLAFAACGWRAHVYQRTSLDPALEGRELVLQGTVASMPQRGVGGMRFQFDLESATEQGRAVGVPPRIYLGWYGDGGAQGTVPDLMAGQRWQLRARLKAPHGNANPGGFDYELWLWEQGLQATGYVRTGKGLPPALLDTAWSHPVERLRQQVRDAIYARVSDRRSAGIVAALLVGDQAAIERADWDVFRATGVAHLMSISGLHVTLFAWLAGVVLGWLWRGSNRLCLAVPAPQAAAWGGLVLAAGYALFSGWGVPAQRTVLMLAVAVALRTGGARWPWPYVWMAAMASVLAWDPWALLSAGFWLSFVAVGVLFATDSRANSATQESRMRHIKQMLKEQAVVTVALTPLGVLLFGQLSVVGMLANLVAIPWVTLVVTPLAMAGVLWAGFWNASAWCLRALSQLLHGLAGWDYANLWLTVPPLWAGLAGVLGGLLLVARLPWAMRWMGVPLLLPALFWQVPRPAVGQFDVLAPDVGQGMAVLVRTAGHSLLFDTGPRWGPESDAGHRVLVPLLRRAGERLSTVVLSHQDQDHTGGTASVLGAHAGVQVLSSLAPGHPILNGAATQRCEGGQHWVWDGVRFDFLHPTAPDYDVARSTNALSCVIRVSTEGNGASALLTGDIEAAQEVQILVRSPLALRADLMVAPHHGSRTSSTPAFIAAVAPRFVLMQSGYRNRFGHPAPEVVARYIDAGVAVHSSPHCGAATWQSVAPQALGCQRALQRRYWHHRAGSAPDTGPSEPEP